MRYLHPDHDFLDADKEEQKVAQVGLMGNLALEQIFFDVRRFRKDLHIFRTNRGIHFLSFSCIVIRCCTDHLITERGAHISRVRVRKDIDDFARQKVHCAR